MATPTYTALATTTLSSSASSVTFSSIPASYRDLVVVTNFKKNNATTGGYYLWLQFNGDTASNYPFVRMWGENSSGYSTAGTLAGIFAGLAPSGGNVWVMSRSNIMDYSATDKHKTVLSRADWDDSLVNENAYATACRWSNTNAITSVKILIDSQDFASGSTFSLYGIEA